MGDEKNNLNFWKKGVLWGLIVFVIFSLLIALFTPSVIFSKISGFFGRLISSFVIPIETGLAIRSLFEKLLSVLSISVKETGGLIVVQKPINTILIVLKQAITYCVIGAIVGVLVGKIKSKK